MATKFSAEEGSSQEVAVPEEGGRAGLRFLAGLVGSYVEILYFEDGSAMLVTEQGKVHGLPRNLPATAIAARKGGLHGGNYISGDAVFLSRAEVARL